MKRLMLCIALVGVTGCCDGEQKAPVPVMGSYALSRAKVIRKVDVYSNSSSRYRTRMVELEINGKVYPFEIAAKLDAMWWANLVEGRSYEVLTETKPEGSFLWRYESKD